MNAVERWRDALSRWGIPEEILARAEESPWAFSPDLMRRWAEAAIGSAPTAATRRALEALPEGGTVLDVGAGSGAASLPLAPPAAAIVAVDGSDELLGVFRDVAASHGVTATVVQGRWPDVAAAVPVADVVVCQHVLYNVPDLAPFAWALHEHAAGRVVVAITAVHPLSWMSDLWMHFHGLVRPTEPTADVAEAALRELGLDVRREDETRPPRAIGWEDRAEVLARLRRQLCLPAGREDELARVLGNRLVEQDGLWYIEPSEHPVTTLWWDSAA